MITKSIKPFWIIVEVRSGIPISVKAFWDKPSAEKYKKQIAIDINPEDDEITIFPVRVHKRRRSYKQRIHNPIVGI
ncbi:MAG: hypothetical protein A2Z71_07005 [Chloroflexi bacterium RBG_13_50_21]|nr:MAG: hypothetical protein A2Z71_07005 [Chloroflexi bacterium RBG_13_50_21]OGO61716.1 MAG: hypothetical protein A2029_01925 [Chloroflexi bacterium RBG_19FT_COMBO_47_9]